MLTSEQKQQLHRQLIMEKNKLEQELTLHDGRFSQSETDSLGELSSYDNHPADMGTEMEEREKNLALHAHFQKQLEDVNEALQRMKDGSYGICTVSGKEIPYERLEAYPTATQCIEHAQSHPASDRPIEETVIPSSVRNFTLGVEYDAEDSYQDVDRYGSSNSPSDFTESIKDYNDAYYHSSENVGYVEDWENFVATDMHGQHKHIVPSEQQKLFESMLDEYEWRMMQGELESEYDWYD